jgi:hypothetical protein
MYIYRCRAAISLKSCPSTPSTIIPFTFQSFNHVLQNTCSRNSSFRFCCSPINQNSSWHDQCIRHNLSQNFAWVRQYLSVSLSTRCWHFFLLLSSSTSFFFFVYFVIFSVADLSQMHLFPTTLSRRRPFRITNVSSAILIRVYFKSLLQHSAF